ncbi:pepD, partial [Symbiodinium sp. KB8]
MVCEKNADSLHDFEKQGIAAELVAGWILARNTTLGADNGMGVATAMALFGPIPSPAPKLVLVFTIKEEVSLDGARALTPGVLKGRWLLNLDSEEYGILYIGSAGGATDILRSKVMRVPLSAGLEPYDLIVDGFAGGHSGADIHLGHKNALKVAAEVAAKLFQIELSAQLIDFAGGDKDNAIPRRAFVRLGLPSQKVGLLEESLRNFESEIRGELTEADKDFRISLQAPGALEWPEALHEATRSSLLQLLAEIPHGPLRFSEEVPGLVETSNNLAKVSIAGDTVSVTHFARSAVDAQLAEFRRKMK